VRGKVWLYQWIAAFLLLLPAGGALAAGADLIDPVVISGDKLNPLLGRSPDSIEAFAWDGSFKPILLQIDERMTVSVYRRELVRRMDLLSYAFDEGPKAQPDPDPAFDANDELVFMARDAGGKAPAGAGPEGSEACQEIELAPAEAAERLYVYLCGMKAPAAPTTASLMNVESADRIEGQTYVIGYPAGNPLNFNSLQFKGPAGLSENVVDRFKLSLDVSVAFNLANYSLGGADFQSYLRGVRRGPIRVIKEFETVVESWANLQIRTYNHVFFYPYHVEYRLLETAPMNWGGSVNKSDLTLAVDLNHEARGFRFYSEKNPRGELIDGFPSPSEVNMNYGPTSWAGVSGAPGTILVHLGLDRTVPINRDLYYTDYSDRGDPPEAEPGMMGKFGFILRGLQKAGFKQWPVRFAILATPEAYQPGLERPMLRMFENPIKVLFNHHELRAITPDAPPVTDTRAETPGSPFAEAKMGILQTRYLMPSFTWDPTLLGSGLGASYSDSDFLGTGTTFGAGASFTDRGYQSYNITMSELRWIKGVDAFSFNVGYSSFPVMPFYGLGNENDLDDVAYYWWKSTEAYVIFTKYFGRIYGTSIQIGYRDVALDDPIQPTTGDTLAELQEHYGFNNEIIHGKRWGAPVYGREGGNLSGFTMTMFRDLREARDFPKFGNYQALSLQAVSSLWGADYDYARVGIDLRAYFHPDFLNSIPTLDTKVNPRRTLLARFLGEDKNRSFALKLNVSHLIAEERDWYGDKVLEVPFFELIPIGSSSTIRAYTGNRYRDNDMIVLSAEYRWRWWNFQYVSVFFDYGQVMYDVLDTSTWDDKWHPSYGIDWRIHMPPNLTIGLEVAFSEERMFYFTTLSGAY
jgi:hypothetical protein